MNGINTAPKIGLSALATLFEKTRDWAFDADDYRAKGGC